MLPMAFRLMKQLKPHAKLVKANRRVGQDNAEDIITDITEEWKNIDWDLGNNPWLAQGGPAQGLTEYANLQVQTTQNLQFGNTDFIRRLMTSDMI